MKFKDLELSTQVLLKIVFIGLVLALLWAIREVIAIFLLAVVLASALDPLADYLSKKKIPRAVSVLAVYVLVFGLVGMIVYLMAPAVGEQFRVLSSNLPEFLAQFEEKFPMLRGVIGDISGSDFLQTLFGSSDGSVYSGTLGIFSGLFGIITVLVISFYLVVADDNGMKELVRPLVPLSRQNQVMQIIAKVQKKMGYWVLGQIILSLAIFILTFVALKILGIKYALVLALLAGLLEVVPYIGPILSAVPAFFFALIQSPALAVGVIIVYIIVQKMEGYVLVPKIMQKAVGVSPLVVLLSLLVGFKLAGVVGLLLAVPMASAIMVVIEELRGEAGKV